MIQIGQRELAIPLRIWIAVPFVFLVYAAVDIAYLFDRNPSPHWYPDVNFLTIATRLAVASASGFVFVDLAHRARASWYILPLLFLASIAVIGVLADLISSSFRSVTDLLSGMAIGAATARAGKPGIILALWGPMIAAPLLFAMACAVSLTAGIRLLLGLPLLAPDARGEFLSYFLIATCWLAAIFLGVVAIRFFGGLMYSQNANMVPRWLPMTAAIIGSCAVTILQLFIARFNRRQEAVSPLGLRSVVLVIFCILAFCLNPGAYGLQGIHAYYSYVRPALLEIHLTPSSLLIQ